MKDFGAARYALAATLLVAHLATPSVATAASKPKQEAVVTAAVVEDIGEQPDSIYELIWGAKGSLAEGAEVETVAATDVAPRTRRGGPSTEMRSLIGKHAKAHGVPVELAEAVVHVESRFNPKARGRAGEIGLMQIKPATARLIGYRGSAKGLYDPETNLTWGMLYLAQAYKLANGDTCGAILRYNGGHAARKMTKQARTYCSKVNRYVAAL